jgi:hypothetical protein
MKYRPTYLEVWKREMGLNPWRVSLIRPATGLAFVVQRCQTWQEALDYAVTCVEQKVYH